MPPIPIYVQSPINAAKASGVTPQTDGGPGEVGGQANSQPPATTTTTTTSQASPQGGGGAYPPAQPGAVPSLPTPTGTVPNHHGSVQPTPTQRVADPSPPPPQPGAAPTPPGARSTHPPPPRAGETYHPPEQTPAPTVPYPSQATIPAPTVPYPGAQRGTATATAGAYAPTSQSIGLGSDSGGTGYLSHPPGYHQNTNASEFDSNQREANFANVSSGGCRGSAYGDDGEEGVWDVAKKLVQQAGEKLSAAEGEVWRRINKE